ncbi:hypothetical protein C8R44DRAFT_903564 [Mycena epipterygia]|nr:hypothetical protein C8R44DRAFT_903564 [Mycena epipterygia]
MEKFTEEWAPTGVKSSFRLLLQDSTANARQPTALGTKVQYTAICGFGWRFSFRVNRQSAPAVVVDDAGNTIESFQLQLSFDPHLITSGAYGTLALTTQVEHLISVQPPTPVEHILPTNQYSPMETPLGTYVYPSNAPPPKISITVTFPATLGLALPHPLEPQMEQTLEGTLTGKELVDIKFYAFSRRGSASATHPQPLFANSALLRGFSDDLDACEEVLQTLHFRISVLAGHGFSESAVVDLDAHKPEQSAFKDYGYDSDSDLESEGEDDPSPPSSASDTETKPNPALGQSVRKGRVVVLKDTAFTTWKALLYYLYTRRVNFRPLRSEGPKELAVHGPACSPKSMYRLADKASDTIHCRFRCMLINNIFTAQLGLDELQALALAAISARLSEGNILEEMFSSFTSVYPVIQELEVGVLTSNFSEKASEGLKDMTQKICDGEKPYSAETLFMVMRKMGAVKK